MSWQFTKPFIQIINGTKSKIGCFTSSSDVTCSKVLKKIMNSNIYYVPLNSTKTDVYLSNIRKVINSSAYYIHSNSITCKVTYTRTSTVPTAGVTMYVWNITNIELEAPLPVASSFTIDSSTVYTLPANSKTVSSSTYIFTTTAKNTTSKTLSFSASDSGVTVSGSCTLGASGTVTFIIS